MFIEKVYSETYDPNTQTKNNVFRGIYAARLKGLVEELLPEKDSGLGFQAYSIEELKNLQESDKKKFIPSLITEKRIEKYEKMISVLFTNPL